MSDTFIAISGGFDPIHSGHVDYIKDAAGFGKVVVILNSDEWLIRKKGYAFMKFAERKTILESMFHVHLVIAAQDGDDTVCITLNMLKDTIKYFGKGGDRWQSNTPEAKLCEKHEINIIYGLGGFKTQSSSELVRNVQKN